MPWRQSGISGAADGRRCLRLDRRLSTRGCTSRPGCRTLLRRLARQRQKVILPSLALAEICGAIARRSDSSDVAPAVLPFLLAQSWIEYASLDAALGREAAALAIACRLRGADAVYVALAAARRLPLVTLDAEMLERAPASIDGLTPAAWLQRTSR
jgi:predicted nucleic acid-binding protein